MQKLLIAILVLVFFAACKSVKTESSSQNKWTPLLGENWMENWEIYIGAPHATVKDLPGVDPKSDGKNAEALGLNNDPKHVFTFEKEGRDIVMHVSGEIYGCVTTKETYGNYRLRLQFKWGEKKWEPRLTKPRDSGILYHAVGSHGSFWNVWMTSQEFQVMEGECGDYFALAGTLMDIPAIVNKEGGERDYEKGASLLTFSSVTKEIPGFCNRGFNNEKPFGEWNTLELVCLGDSSLHVVNGQVVMALFHSRYQNANEEIVPLRKGKIQIQSEGAEIYYRNIEIMTTNAFPEEYNKQLTLK